MNYIVIPEGIAADNSGKSMLMPSFVYRQVLDYVLAIICDKDTVFLAPANTYGTKSEHELAYDYIINKNQNAHVVCPRVSSGKYIDTRGNARHLKTFLNDKFMKLSFDLVCARIHSYRAEYIFKKEGFKLDRIHRVNYITMDENIASRWWYYKYKPVHAIYETLVFSRDIIFGRLT